MTESDIPRAKEIVGDCRMLNPGVVLFIEQVVIRRKSVGTLNVACQSLLEEAASTGAST